MRTIRIVNANRNIVLAERAMIADSFWRRGWGLLGRAALGPDEGIVLTKTSCIHSMFMRFAFDALYVGDDLRILRSLKCFLPNRFGPFDRRAAMVIELPSGTIRKSCTVIGDFIILEQGICSSMAAHTTFSAPF